MKNEHYLLAREINDSILSGFCDSQEQLAEYIPEDMPQHIIDRLKQNLEKALLVSNGIPNGRLPTLAEFREHQIGSEEIAKAYSILTFDHARPMQYIDHLKTLCSNKEERELLAYAVFGYDNNEFRHGGLMPLVNETAALLERLDVPHLKTKTEA